MADLKDLVVTGDARVVGTLYANVDGSIPWEDVTGKPSTYTPSSHSHAASDVTSGEFDADRIPKSISITGTAKGVLDTEGNHALTVQQDTSSSCTLLYNEEDQVAVNYAASAGTATTATNYSASGGIATALSGKSDTSHTHSQYATTTTVSGIDTRVTTIEGKIPSAASTTNQLTDLAQVKSLIIESAGTFLGTKTTETESEFQTWAMALTGVIKSDYIMWAHTVSGSAVSDRYSCTNASGTTFDTKWKFEYRITNVSFTEAQWAAINSGATSTKIGGYDTHVSSTANPHAVTASQVGAYTTTQTDTLLASKANTSGTYSSLSVGNATNSTFLQDATTGEIQIEVAEESGIYARLHDAGASTFDVMVDYAAESGIASQYRISSTQTSNISTALNGKINTSTTSSQTITASGAEVPLFLKSGDSTVSSYIGFKSSNDTVQGYLGCNNKKPYFYKNSDGYEIALATGTYSNMTVGTAASANSVAWTNVSGRPTALSSFTDDLGSSPTHTHDGRYYTETEVDTLLSGKANTSHTHAASDITSGLATVATSGSYNDLSNKPTIPSTDDCEKTANKVTAWSTTPSDSYYASEKLIKDSLNLGGLSDWATVTDVTISGVIYHTFWKIAPTSSNQTYGWAVHPSNGLLYYIYNNKGTYSATGYSANSDTYTSAYCSTGASTAAKVASCSGYVLRNPSHLHIIMTNTNTAQSALTLNVRSTGAKPIYINGSPSSATNYNLPAGPYIIYYNGSAYFFRTDSSLTTNIAGSATSASYAYVLSEDDCNVTVQQDSEGRAWLMDTERDTKVDYSTTAGSVAWTGVSGTPTTLSGYGITDAKIASGVITLGGNTITPLTSHQSLASCEKTANKITSWSTTASNTYYPSEALVKTALDGKAASSHTHAASEVTSGTFDAARIPSLAASQITSGTFDAARIPTSISITGSAGSVVWTGVSGTPTTLSGYGITDAKIASGVITLGANTITPLTSHQSLSACEKTANKVTAWSTTTTTTNYPCEKLVKDSLDGKADTSGTYSGLSVGSATTATNVAWSGITSNPITANKNLTVGATSVYTGSVTVRSNGSSATIISGPNNGTATLYAGTYTSSATTANASTNTASTLVLRDASGNFSAGTITASLTGNVTGNCSGSSGSCTGTAKGILDDQGDYALTVEQDTSSQCVLLYNGSTDVSVGYATSAGSANTATNYSTYGGIATALAGKANTSGTYSGLTVGSATYATSSGSSTNSNFLQDATTGEIQIEVAEDTGNYARLQDAGASGFDVAVDYATSAGTASSADSVAWSNVTSKTSVTISFVISGTTYTYTVATV